MMNCVVNSSSSSSNSIEEVCNDKVASRAHDPFGNYHVNIAGISHLPLTSWIVDTGATNHMTSHAAWLIDLMPCSSNASSVQLPNDTRSRVTHTGLYRISGNHIFKGVLHVSDFRYNMLSISKLCSDLSCFVSFLYDLHADT